MNGLWLPAGGETGNYVDKFEIINHSVNQGLAHRSFELADQMTGSLCHWWADKKRQVTGELVLAGAD